MFHWQYYPVAGEKVQRVPEIVPRRSVDSVRLLHVAVPSGLPGSAADDAAVGTVDVSEACRTLFGKRDGKGGRFWH